MQAEHGKKCFSGRESALAKSPLLAAVLAFAPLCPTPFDPFLPPRFQPFVALSQSCC